MQTLKKNKKTTDSLPTSHNMLYFLSHQKLRKINDRAQEGQSHDNRNEQKNQFDEHDKAAKFHGGLFLYKFNPGTRQELTMITFLQKFVCNIIIEPAINTYLGWILAVVGFEDAVFKYCHSRASGNPSYRAKSSACNMDPHFRGDDVNRGVKAYVG